MKEILVKNPSTLTVHPAAALFPIIEGAEFDELVADIRANGLRTPIVLHDGQVLDGRNRLKACELAEIRPAFVEWDGSGSVVDWVFSANFHRRHLSASQRCMLAAHREKLRAIEHRERFDRDARLPEAAPGRTIEKVAGQVAVSVGSLHSAQVVLEKGVPELVAKVESGEVRLGAAVKVASLPHDEQREVVRAGREAEKAKEIRAARAAASPIPRQPPAPPQAPPRQLPRAADARPWAPTDDAPLDDHTGAEPADREDTSAGLLSRIGAPHVIDLSAFHFKYPNGTTRKEEAAKVDEVLAAVSSGQHALMWMMLDWDKRQVWDMDFARWEVPELRQHLQIAVIKLELIADICHGRKKEPERRGS